LRIEMGVRIDKTGRDRQTIDVENPPGVAV
jgi:hypothetical protein